MKMSRFLFAFGYHVNIDIQNGQNTLLYVGPKGFGTGLTIQAAKAKMRMGIWWNQIRTHDLPNARKIVLTPPEW